MVEILTQDDRARAVRRLRFCYLCGNPMGPRRGVDWSQEHVPPVAYVSSRAAALPMRAHPACNNELNLRDERAGQLMSTQLHRYPSPEDLRFEVATFTDPATGETRYGVPDFGLEDDVRRIVRAFHAALYNDFLPDAGINVSLPCAVGHAPSGHVEADPPPPWHKKAVLDLNGARDFKRLDRILCEGGECEYICTWFPHDGRLRCVFGLRLHVGRDFGEPAFGQRGCVGHYVRDALPAGASVAPGIVVPVRVVNPMDPFAMREG